MKLQFVTNQSKPTSTLFSPASQASLIAYLLKCKQDEEDADGEGFAGWLETHLAGLSAAERRALVGGMGAFIGENRDLFAGYRDVLGKNFAAYLANYTHNSHLTPLKKGGCIEI